MAMTEPHPADEIQPARDSGLDDLFSPLHRAAMARLLAQAEEMRAQSAGLAGRSQQSGCEAQNRA